MPSARLDVSDAMSFKAEDYVIASAQRLWEMLIIREMAKERKDVGEKLSFCASVRVNLLTKHSSKVVSFAILDSLFRNGR